MMRIQKLEVGSQCFAAVIIGVMVAAILLPGSSAAVADTHDDGPGSEHAEDGHAHAHQHGTGRCVTEYRDRPGTGRSCKTDRGTYKVRLHDGTELETHGPDEADDVLAAPGNGKGGGQGGGGGSSPSPSPSPSPSSVPPLCAETGTDRSELIYAVARDDVDRYAESVQTIRDRFSYANDLVSGDAAAFGTQLSYRVRCDADGQPSVAHVVLDMPKSAASFYDITNALNQAGYSDPYTDYWVFYDDYVSGKGGEGNMCFDDRLAWDNACNRRVPSYGIGYGYWWDTPIVMVHENGHNMGAVQLTAPNSTGAGHCNDSYDIMCYNDGGPKSAQTYPCTDRYHYDCGKNDYFHPDPSASNYLYDHWNLGSCYNLKLFNPSCPEPPVNESPIVSAGEDQRCEFLPRVRSYGDCSTGSGTATDPEGALHRYQWSFVECPSKCPELYRASGMWTTTTGSASIPKIDFRTSYSIWEGNYERFVGGTYRLRLTVWDAAGNVGMDEVVVVASTP